MLKCDFNKAAFLQEDLTTGIPVSNIFKCCIEKSYFDN